jgi:serine kinase of HPr protein (carbohydrate metabolism regulator)
MKVSDLVETLNLKIFSAKEGLTRSVNGAYVSDLLSDVMGNAAEGEIWITLQTHQNVMAVASLKELAAVILVKNLEPEKEMLEKSEEEGIPVLGTSMQTFETAGKLFNLIKK